MPDTVVLKISQILSRVQFDDAAFTHSSAYSLVLDDVVKKSRSFLLPEDDSD